MRSTVAFLLLGLATQQASATFGWTNFPQFKSPKTSDNKCSQKEKSGWRFEDLNIGQFSSYSDFSFNGFSCEDKPAKRDSLGRRTFGGRSIKGSLSKSKGPKFSCQKDGFSVDQYQISTSKDVDIEFHYEMPDGSSCKHVSPCKAGGSTVKNDQCGGAKTVTFKLPDNSKDDDCDLDIHEINFDCNPPVNNQPPPSQPSPPQSSESSVIPDVPSPLPSDYVPPQASLPPFPKTHSPRPPFHSTAGFPKPGNQGPSQYPASPSIPSIPSESPSHPPQVPDIPSPSTPSSPLPSAPCPDVLPKCMNTWLHLTSCRDNADHECFCGSDDFTAEVYSCVSAWAASDLDVQGAIGYYMGICASHIPKNPGIVTNCPSSITIGPTPVPDVPVPQVPVPQPPAGGAAPEPSLTTEIVITTVSTCPPGQTITQNGVPTVLPTPSVLTIYVTQTTTVCNVCAGGAGGVDLPMPTPIVPYTTVTVHQSVTVPCTYSEGPSAGLEIPESFTTSDYSSVVTIPQVAFTTPAAGATQGVQLVPAATSAPAAPFPAVELNGTSTLATVPVAVPTGSSNTSSPVVPFEGGASKLGREVGALVVGLVVAMAMV